MEKQNKNIVLRTVLPEDYKKVRKLAETIWPVCYKDILSVGQISYMMEMMYAEDVIARETAEGIHYCFVDADGAVAGYLAWGQWDAAPGTVKLHKLYLLPEMQGEGIGSRTIETVKRQLRSVNVHRIRLNVNRQNTKAIKCYINNGFTLVQQEDNDIGNGFFMTDYVMEAKI